MRSWPIRAPSRRGPTSGIVAIAGNIGDRSVAQQVAAAAIERYGRIDTLINNAGVFISKPFTEYTAEDYDNAIGVNLGGFFHITQFALAQMLKQASGHIVQITTTLVEQPLANVPAGLASLTKGGLAAVTRGAAIEYARQDIRVNAVAPGIIKTPMHAPETHAFLDGLHPSATWAIYGTSSMPFYTLSAPAS